MFLCASATYSCSLLTKQLHINFVPIACLLLIRLCTPQNSLLYCFCGLEMQHAAMHSRKNVGICWSPLTRTKLLDQKLFGSMSTTPDLLELWVFGYSQTAYGSANQNLLLVLPALVMYLEVQVPKTVLAPNYYLFLSYLFHDVCATTTIHFALGWQKVLSNTTL